MKRIAFFMVLIMVFSLFATACATTTDSVPSVAAPSAATEAVQVDEGWVGGYCPLSNNIFFDAIGAGLEKAAEETGGSIVRQGTELSLQKERAVIESFIEQEVDVIFLTPTDATGSIETIRVANDAGIPVVIISNQPIGDFECLAFIKSDDYTAACDITRYAMEEINEEGKVVILNGIQTPDAIERINGFKDTLAEYENVELVNEVMVSENSVSACTRAVENMLQADPDAAAVLCWNGFGIPAAYAAMENLGIDTNSICVVDVDGLPEEADLLASGRMEKSAAMGQNSYGFGLKGVEVFLEWRANPDAWEMKQVINLPTVLLTPENADTYEVYAWVEE